MQPQGKVRMEDPGIALDQLAQDLESKLRNEDVADRLGRSMIYQAQMEGAKSIQLTLIKSTGSLSISFEIDNKMYEILKPLHCNEQFMNLLINTFLKNKLEPQEKGNKEIPTWVFSLNN